MVIIIGNDSQKTKSGVHAFLETLCACSFLLVAAGDAIVVGEKGGLEEKWQQQQTIILRHRLLSTKVVPDNTPLASSNLIRYKTDPRIRYLKRQVH
jgi:hypothetical protein